MCSGHRFCPCLCRLNETLVACQMDALYTGEWSNEISPDQKTDFYAQDCIQSGQHIVGEGINFYKFVTLCYTGRLFQGLNSHIGITVVSYMELPVLNFPSFASRTPA